MFRFISALCFFLCIAFFAPAHAENIEKYNSLKSGENIFYGRGWYVREKDLEGKKLGWFETMFVDPWKIDKVAICFADGTRGDDGKDKEICSVIDAFSSRPRDYKGGKDGFFSIRTASRKVEFRKLVFSSGDYVYTYAFQPAPRLTVSETGKMFYMGDFAMALVPSGKGKEVPRLRFQILNNMKETTDFFAHYAGAASGTRVIGKSFNMKGKGYKLTVQKVIYHYSVTPVFRRR